MSTPITATQLFARYTPQGNEICFYCGGRCDQSNPASEIVKKTFTGLDTVTLSNWVCDGCIAAMAEKVELRLIDGTKKSNQKIRGYSWIFNNGCREACTKAHRRALEQACTVPIEPPFVVCISDSGQKHLLYRAVVNHSRDVVTVTLEGEPITYRPSELEERLRLCRMVCAAVGKPALKESMSVQSQMRVIEYYESESVLSSWINCHSEPLTRLATWLCPAKSECSIEFPESSVADGNGILNH